MSVVVDNMWSHFINELPQHQLPYSKKNWGNPNHSLCSYQGKLKPSIAYHLVNIFVPKDGQVFDPFSGVGTIPFEAALNGRRAFGMDISPLAYYVSSAKLHRNDEDKCLNIISKLNNFIEGSKLPRNYFATNSKFGFNRTLAEYYNKNTFKEILKARLYFQQNPPTSSEEMLVISSLLHILHGNRPYALSRRSHPIVPYAPTGEYEYKNLINKLTDKVIKSVRTEMPADFHEGTMFLQDSTTVWPEEINDLDAIITSPPFFDSTRFYMANWIRLWFVGWNNDDFKEEPKKYIDEKQKEDFAIYDSIFEQGRERLKDGGYFVMHLGKSKKCDMGEVLLHRYHGLFRNAHLYIENVENCAKFGIKDLGTVTDHEYLVLEK